MYAVVDIETTGGKPSEDGIIEIAILVTDGKKIIDQYQSLINPAKEIPNYISSLTGIHQEMLYDAPSFADIAGEIHNYLKDNIFIAHNVAFDYNFVKYALGKHRINFNSKRLCTVRLARKIFPGLPSYSLGRLCESLAINISDRHRAFGDAAATVELFSMMVENDTDNWIEKALKGNSKEATLPPNLSKEIYEELPEEPGVYYFINEKEEIIYVGKAKNIKKRITSHFTKDLQKKNMVAFRNSITNIQYELTGNELIAYLLESHEIKRLQPPFNYAQRRINGTYGVFSYTDRKGYVRFAIDKATPSKPALATFPALTDARNFLQSLSRKHDLCLKMAGIQHRQDTCTEYSFKICKGACAGEETADNYNERAVAALKYIQNMDANLLIIGEGRHVDEQSIVCLENGKYVGYGYFSSDISISQPEAARDFINPYPDNADIQRIIRQYLRRPKGERIIRY